MKKSVSMTSNFESAFVEISAWRQQRFGPFLNLSKPLSTPQTSFCNTQN